MDLFSPDNFVSEDCDDMNLVTFDCELLTGESFHDLLHCDWLFFTNVDNPKIGSLSCRECSFPWNIVNLIDRYRSFSDAHNNKQ